MKDATFRGGFESTRLLEIFTCLQAGHSRRTTVTSMNLYPTSVRMAIVMISRITSIPLHSKVSVQSSQCDLTVF
jgi:hypothetical protein